MSSQYYPQELVKEILIRLPSKSLLRFTSVCKSWYSLITHASFISLHHQHSSSFFLLQILKEPVQFDPANDIPLPIHCSIHHDDRFLTAASNSSLPIPFPLDSFIVAICHGLILLSCNYEHYSLIICNPSLRRFIPLPTPIPIHDDIDPFISNSAIFTFGFGFDSQNRDYKVARIGCTLDEMRCISFFEVQVYSLASGFWRKLHPTIAPFCITSWTNTNNNHALVNGLIHWGARRWFGEENRTCCLFVLSFCFEDEVFQEVMLPNCLSPTFSNEAMVTVVGGNVDMDLTVYHLNNLYSSGSIWVMKEYGVIESWNKLFAFDLIDSCLQSPSLEITITDVRRDLAPAALCVTNNGEILLMVYSASLDLGNERLYLLDVENKSLVNLQIGGGEDYRWFYIYVGYYTESLVLLDNNG